MSNFFGAVDLQVGKIVGQTIRCEKTSSYLSKSVSYNKLLIPSFYNIN